MKILHVSQGLPPFRVGGLTRYCVDLMEEQMSSGHHVSLLYPGHYSFGKTRIISRESPPFTLHEIVNPLPMSLVFGINAPERYIKRCNSKCFEEFFKTSSFDVIHIHSMMGIHREFVEAAKAANIRMVLTTHDYYLLCPRCTLFMDTNLVCSGPGAEKCQICNAGIGLSASQEIIMQSRIYKKLKYSSIVTKMRHSSRDSITSKVTNAANASSTPSEYGKLLKYNRSILQLVDTIHCNSALTQSVYEKFEPDQKYYVIPISHSNLPQKRVSVPNEKAFRIMYLGGPSFYKGYHVLHKAVQELDALGFYSWELHLYGGMYPKDETNDRRINLHGYFSWNQLQQILMDITVLVVPSVCYETFGYVVLEALAAGVPVIVSDKVGSRDLLLDAPVSLVVPSGDHTALAEKLLEVSLHRDELLSWVQGIDVLSMEKHTKDIVSLYQEG